MFVNVIILSLLHRLDCLRRIAKGTVDFSVFSSEDLLAATWANIDVLVTDELRFHQGKDSILNILNKLHYIICGCCRSV